MPFKRKTLNLEKHANLSASENYRGEMGFVLPKLIWQFVFEKLTEYCITIISFLGFVKFDATAA